MKYDEAELIGRHFLTLIRPDYVETAKAFYGGNWPNGRRIRTSSSRRSPRTDKSSGSASTCSSSSRATRSTGVQAIARDISKQKEAEERLRQSESRYRSLIQGAAYGIYLATVDGRILDANPAFARMLGLGSVDAAASMNMNDIWARPEDRAAFIRRYRDSGAPTLSGEVEWKKKDGGSIMVRLTAHLVDVDGNEDSCFEGIVEDITERRALEEQLRQSQKMEAIGRLARGIAHDFNNVLAAILGNSDLIQIRLKPDDPLHTDIHEIAKAAERGAALTRQLLVFSRRQALAPEVLNLHTVVSNFDMMMQRLSGDIQLKLSTPGPAPMVRMEPGQIEQVVMNLVVNARDAIQEGGTISVIADLVNVDQRGSARHAGIAPGRYARIAVHDTGKGIDPEMQRHLFEPFFTTKDPAKGSGLGLSIVYGIAKEAGGTVTCSSAPSQGTTFEVLLPVAPDS